MAPNARSARTLTHQLRARAARNEMNENISLGRIAGIHVGFNWSLLVIAALIAWSLATGSSNQRAATLGGLRRRSPDQHPRATGRRDGWQDGLQREAIG